jgi:hypothetical protein
MLDFIKIKYQSNSIGSARSAPVFLTLPTFLSTGQIFNHSSGHGRLADQT